MTRRGIVLGVLLLCTGVPPLFVISQAISFDVSNRVTGSLNVGGEDREYVVYVPPSYDARHSTPLVISLHGAANWPWFQRNVSEWNDLADREGFIVVYPAGGGAGPKTWALRERDEPSRMADAIFIARLIDVLQATYNIDARRIYANGLSGGAGMAFALSCAFPDRIAAIGSVAAAEVLPWSWCPATNPIPVIAFHGTADRVTPYHGGKVWLAPRPFPSIPEWTANWARRNGCATTPVESRVAADVVRLEYAACAENTSVVLHTIVGGGHTWPGGGDLPEWLLGKTTRNIDATSEMWNFFRKHRRCSPNCD